MRRLVQKDISRALLVDEENGEPRTYYFCNFVFGTCSYVKLNDDVMEVGLARAPDLSERSHIRQLSLSLLPQEEREELIDVFMSTNSIDKFFRLWRLVDEAIKKYE